MIIIDNHHMNVLETHYKGLIDIVTPLIPFWNPWDLRSYLGIVCRIFGHIFYFDFITSINCGHDPQWAQISI